MIEIVGDRATGAVAANRLFHDIEKGPVQVSGLYYDRFERRGEMGISVEAVIALLQHVLREIST